jgi:hypothetical protein
LTLFTQDGNPVNHVGRSSGGAFNLRTEPLDARSGSPPLLFSSKEHGDPATPLVEAYLGDPVVVRDLAGATNEVHTWHIDGHWFRAEPFSATSPPISTIHLGISERFDLVIPRAGGPQQMPGDYLYYSGRAVKLREGSWGVLRVRDGNDGGGLRKLAGHETIPAPTSTVCPDDAPVKRFDVHAVDVPLPMLDGKPGKAYVLAADKARVLGGKKKAEPLVLHVGVGDCVKLQLTNDTTAGPVSYHCDLLASDPKDSGGVAAGNEPDQSVPPGGTRSYTYYASPEVGETAALGRDWGNVLTNPRLGLYAAIVVGPRRASYRDPSTGASLNRDASWQAAVVPKTGPAYRDFTLFMQDEDDSIGTHRMPYTTSVRGVVGLNYEKAPLNGSLADAIRAGPSTPMLRAFAGDPVRVHVLAPWSEQAQVFSVEGHQWPQERAEAGTNMLSSVQLGGLETATLDLIGGAGGPARLAGDYVYGDHREPYREAGSWGVLRVLRPGSHPSDHLKPLPGTPASPRSYRVQWLALGAAALAVAVVVWRRRKGRETL